MHRALLVSLAIVGASLVACTGAVGDGEIGGGTDDHDATSCGESAQNECPGWPGPPDTLIKDCLAMMWAEGPGSDFHAHGHYINMSSTSYSSVSCGFYQTPAGDWWAAQDFR